MVFVVGIENDLSNNDWRSKKHHTASRKPQVARTILKEWSLDLHNQHPEKWLEM